MVSVGEHPNIELLTWSEVERVDGYVGNFSVTVRKKTALCRCGSMHRLWYLLGEMPEESD